MIKSEERGRYLEFEQIHWKVQSYYVHLLNLRTLLNKKQGDKNQTEQICYEYKVLTKKKKLVEKY